MRLNKFKESNRLKCSLFEKLESFNPAGSAKDRVALKITEDAYKEVKVGRNISRNIFW